MIEYTTKKGKLMVNGIPFEEWDDMVSRWIEATAPLRIKLAEIREKREELERQAGVCNE